ncbi:MAG: TonB-dependent receptor [Bacteroidota bacterium]
MKQHKSSVLLSVVTAMFIVVPSLRAEDTLSYSMPQVIVQSSRMSLTSFDLNQSATILGEEMLHNAAPLSVGDALRMFTATEVRRRAPFGIQTDIGIRGSTFSQQLILFNGLRINDPQTAHHNFDIPVPMNSVSQIEIVRGPNSMLYGPDAFGGIINIVSSSHRPLLTAELSGGEHGYAAGTLSTGYSADSFSSINTASYSRSDGFRYDTEFEQLTLSSQNSANVSWGIVNGFAGYTKKDFGAYDFYSPGSNIPSHEKTETYLAAFGTSFTAVDWNFNTRISYRHHFDHFIYTIVNPPLSNNQHNTNLYSAEISANRSWNESFILTHSIEFMLDNINSSKLGIHTRNSSAFSTIVRWIPVDQWSIDGGVRIDAHSEYGVTLHPTFGAGYLVSSTTKIYGSAGTSFRAASYTDLYYGDPKTVGNPLLKPERGFSSEVGIHTQLFDAASLQASAFFRQQNDLIDYVQYSPTDKYYAQNFSEAVVKGIEVQSLWKGSGNSDDFLKQIVFNYTFIESDLDIKSAYRTRYSFTHPKHQLNGAVTLALPLEIITTVNAVYSYHSTRPSSSIVDLTFMRPLESIDFIIAATNLLNKSYEEIPGIPLPGRWITGTMRWSME